MSTSRDRYEEWAASVMLKGRVTKELITSKRDGETYTWLTEHKFEQRRYFIGVVSAGWEAWQASISSLEVQP